MVLWFTVNNAVSVLYMEFEEARVTLDDEDVCVLSQHLSQGCTENKKAPYCRSDHHPMSSSISDRSTASSEFNYAHVDSEDRIQTAY